MRDPNNNFLQNPYLILTARLVSPKDDDSSTEGDSPSPSPKENALTGTVVSSLYSLKDTDNSQGGFFVFGDLSVRKEGYYRLEFTLYELKLGDRECWMLNRVLSDRFQVFSQKEFPGMAESTFLTRSFSDQGVRLRLRKDSRSITTRKRNSSVARQADTVRGSLHQQYHPAVHSPEHSPTGHPHAQYRRSASLHDPGMSGAHMERPRPSMTPQGGNFYDSPQMGREYGSGYQHYSGYASEERSAKRQRVDPSLNNHGYDEGYTSYSQSGPRTVPDLAGSIYPVTTTGYQMTSQPAMASLSGPTSHYSMPRLNTQMAPQHHTGPNSATSPFSPSTQRSPGAAYHHYPPQGQVIYSTGMPYQQAVTPPTNGLGIGGVPHLELEVDNKSAVRSGAQ